MDEQNFIVNHRSGLSDRHESSSSPNYLVPESSLAMRSSFVALGLCTPSAVAIAIGHQESIEQEMAQRRVGEVVRGRVLVDAYGDNVQATALPGDHFRTRHNALLHHLNSACQWAGLPCQLEVHNLFAGVMHQPGLSRAEQARQYQGLVPDMRITMPGVGYEGGGVGAPGLPAGGLAGQSSAVLHELKVISCSSTRYRPTRQQRAVDYRASQLQGEYVAKARAADRRQGIPEGTVGRVEAKLLELGHVEGLVAGQFGEVSEATHALLAILATSRVRIAGVSRGKRKHMRSEEGERAVAISSLRRRLGVMTVRCQASSLLGRLETRWGCSSREAATGRRSGEEVEKRVPGSPAGYHPQLESPALWIRQTGLDHYSMVTNYFKIATYYCKSEFKEIYVCQL